VGGQCPSNVAAEGKLPVRVRIGNAQRRQYLGFEAFHLKGLVFLDVVVAQKVQESVHHQMGEMVRKADVHPGRFALERLAGETEVADQPEERRERFDLRKTEDIGGFVDLPPLAVEDALVGIVGEQDRDFTDAGDLCARLVEGLEQGTLCQRLDILGPALGLDVERDLERRTLLQLALSPFAVAPS
jgi:hypothetical protein